MQTKRHAPPRYWIEFEDRHNKAQRTHPLVYRSPYEAHIDAYRERRDSDRGAIYRYQHGRLYRCRINSMVFCAVPDYEREEKLETLAWIMGITKEQLLAA